MKTIYRYAVLAIMAGFSACSSTVTSVDRTTDSKDRHHLQELNKLVEDLTRGERRQDYPDEREPRYRALRTFREMGDAASPAIPALTKLLHDERFAMEAASALVSIGAESVDPLIKALDDKNEEVRSRSAYALGELRAEAKAAVPALLKLASNTNETITVRTHAVWALGQIGHEPVRVVPLLNALLKHPNNTLRSSATQAIGAFGNNARESIATLTLLLNDEDRLVRHGARKSLILIENANHSHANPRGFDKWIIRDSPYQTKPIWLTDSGAMFYWFITEDRQAIGYEPSCGWYEIDLVKESKEELVFKIIESRGRPLDLIHGQPVAKADVVGKEFRVKIKGDQILAVASNDKTPSTRDPQHQRDSDATNFGSKDESIAINEMAIPSFMKIIITGSPEARAQALSKYSILSGQATEDAKAFLSPVMQYRSFVMTGKASKKEFEYYCKTVEILINDYMKAWETKDPTPARSHLRLVLNQLAGNPYHNLEVWAPKKEELEKRQKWAKPVPFKQ